MKILKIAVFVCLFASLCYARAAASNFAGTWVVDMSKSEGLMGPMADAKSITYVVIQDDKRITIEAKLVDASGQTTMIKPLPYNLDGSTSNADVDLMGNTMKAILKAKWMGDGKILELNREMSGSISGNDVTVTIKDHWELSSDGKVLKIHRNVDSPMGTQEQKLVLNKA